MNWKLFDIKVLSLDTALSFMTLMSFLQQTHTYTHTHSHTSLYIHVFYLYFRSFCCFVGIVQWFGLLMDLEADKNRHFHSQLFARGKIASKHTPHPVISSSSSTLTLSSPYSSSLFGHQFLLHILSPHLLLLLVLSSHSLSAFFCVSTANRKIYRKNKGNTNRMD